LYVVTNEAVGQRFTVRLKADTTYKLKPL